jgi:rSAM/selenodomain-associated transferase 2
MRAQASSTDARLALIVPVLNEACLVHELAAELAACAPRAEVVVVDGGSDDDTRAMMERCAGGAFRVLGGPRGRAQQMNAGARATRAPVLLFLHADTRLPAGALDAVTAAVDGGAVGGCFRLRIASADPRLRLAARLINLRSRLLPSASGDQAIFVRRSAFARLGGFRELELCEDLDLVARLRQLGRFALVDDAVETSARRWERNGVARTIALMWALRIGFHLGVDPSTLGRIYGPDVR